MSFEVTAMNSKNLVLYGYKSTGKTFYGKLLAKEVNCSFIDTDMLIMELYKQKFSEDLNCRQISLKLGQSGFRKLENEVISSLEMVANAVIALGGGAVLDPTNCQKLAEIGKLIYLETDKETLKSRIFKDGIPSFLNADEPELSFEKMYAERKPLYEKLAACKVQTHGKTDQEVIQELKAFR